MRILWASNAPWAPTGYGTQTRQMLKRLLADGHEVAIASNWGVEAGTIPDPETGVPIFARGIDGYGNDVIPELHRRFRADWTISLYDVWVYRDPGFDAINIASWTPIDHQPVPPDVTAWARKHPTIAMSRWGQAQLERQGVDAMYAPHGIDLGVFKPTPSDIRSRLGIPDDAFLVCINAANKGASPPRKAWHEMLFAVSMLMAEHPDVHLYMNTELAPVHHGLDLAILMMAVDIDPKRVHLPDPFDYRMGWVTEANLAELYSASDVLLATSMGEGFGIPVVEAQACGLPVIVTDFSAQPELVGGGWTVGSAPYWDHTQGAHFVIPSIPGIRNALEKARDAKGDADLRARAVAKAAEYDADRVYAESWRPILANLEERLKPPTRQERRRRKLKS